MAGCGATTPPWWLVVLVTEAVLAGCHQPSAFLPHPVDSSISWLQESHLRFGLTYLHGSVATCFFLAYYPALLLGGLIPSLQCKADVTTRDRLTT